MYLAVVQCHLAILVFLQRFMDLSCSVLYQFLQDCSASEACRLQHHGISQTHLQCLLSCPCCKTASALGPVGDLVETYHMQKNQQWHCLFGIASLFRLSDRQLSKILFHCIFSERNTPTSSGCNRCVEFGTRLTNLISFSVAAWMTGIVKCDARLSPISTLTPLWPITPGRNISINQRLKHLESNHPDGVAS